MKYTRLLLIIIIGVLNSANKPPTGNFEELLLDIEVNQEHSNILTRVLRFQDGSLLVPVGELKKLRVSKNYLLYYQTNFRNHTYLNLKGLHNVKYDLNTQILSLKMTFPPESMRLQSLDAEKEFDDEDLVDSPTYGAYLNYDTTFSQSKKMQHIAGIYGVNYFTPKYGVFKSEFFVENKFYEKNNDQFVRLNSNWTFESREDSAQWRVGDSTTKNSNWSSSTRFVGIQYATNFDVNPGLITHPLIDFTGSATLPSAIDVYVNSRSIYKGNVNSGEFRIENLPIPTGNGDVTVETKDITGKIKTVTIPYYTSSALLAPGLKNFSYSAGAQRHRFGTESNNYRNMVTNIDYMYGMNSSWTSGFHLESMKHSKGIQSTLGITNRVKIKHYGIASVSIANNLHNNASKAQKAVIDYSYHNSLFSFNSRATFYGKKYINALIEKNSNDLSRNSFTSTLGVFSPKYGNFSVNYLSTSSKDEKIQLLSLNYSKQITKNSTVRLSMGQNLSGQKDSFVSLSYNVMFDDKNVSTTVSRRKNKYAKSLSFSKSSADDSQWGYSASLNSQDDINSYDLRARRRYEKASVSISAFGSENRSTQQASISGSVVFIDNNLFLSRSIHSSLALIKVGGHKDISIYKNNQINTKTDKNGKALVPNIAAYTPSKISINSGELPLNSHFLSENSLVTPLRNNGVIVNFRVEERTSLVAQLVDVNDRDLSLDHVLYIEGIENKEYLGYFGQIYLRDVKDMKLLKGEACLDDKCCKFEKEILHDDEIKILNLEKIICK